MTGDAGYRRVTVDVQGRQVTLSNLDKVLYPATGFTKGDLIDYYRAAGPVLLPHVESRPVTFRRYPEGVRGEGFFAKQRPPHAPDWVRTVRLPSPGSTMGRSTVDYVLLCDLPTLVWAANLAALEIHVPAWRVDDQGRPTPPDRMIYDLDPGEPATIVECCPVGLLIRVALAADSLVSYPKTSGAKGLQLYVPLRPDRPWQDVHGYARRLADQVARAHSDLVVSTMRKPLRKGKVLIDWSQNHPAKTTVAPYSLRAREQPTVSTPVTWEEIEACRWPEDLLFGTDDVLRRVEEHGDLFAPLLSPGQSLPA
ncbi:MAG: non-homologous end-joining DNA ligase [Blastococcus sp.]